MKRNWTPREQPLLCGNGSQWAKVYPRLKADLECTGAEDFGTLSKQLALEAVLREGWSKLCQELYKLVAAGFDVPELSKPHSKPSSSAAGSSVQLLRRTMQLLEDCEQREFAVSGICKQLSASM